MGLGYNSGGETLHDHPTPPRLHVSRKRLLLDMPKVAPGLAAHALDARVLRTGEHVKSLQLKPEAGKSKRPNGADVIQEPPHSIECEQSVLGGLLLDNSSWSRIADLISEPDFYRYDHRLIYRHINKLIQAGKPADVITVAESLERAAELANAGGIPYLGSLAKNTPSAANISSYAEVVQDRAVAREIQSIGLRLRDAMQLGASLEHLVEYQHELAEASKRLTSGQSSGLLSQDAFWINEASTTLDLPYVVKGIFGRGQLVVVWGPPGSGKSFVTLDMGAAVGAGVPWRGRRTKKAVVIYVAAESSALYIRNRIAALKSERPEIQDSRVVVMPIALDLLHAEKGDVAAVIQAWRQLADNEEVALIIIDTLAVTFGGGNENTPEDMGQYVANIKRIIADTGCAVIVVHHCGKDEARGMRGHTALLAALDAELAIDNADQPERILRTGKVRDGDGFTDLFAFRLRQVTLGTDREGDPVTTCVVDSTGPDGATVARRKNPKLGRNQKTVLRLLGKESLALPALIAAAKDEGIARNRVYESLDALYDRGFAKNIGGLISLC
jgi:hypothetical protein